MAALDTPDGKNAAEALATGTGSGAADHHAWMYLIPAAWLEENASADTSTADRSSFFIIVSSP